MGRNTQPLGYWDAADVILDDLDDYPKNGGQLRKPLNASREGDKKQLGNALVAWAMLTAMEIEDERGLSPEDEHALPRLLTRDDRRKLTANAAYDDFN